MPHDRNQNRNKKQNNWQDGKSIADEYFDKNLKQLLNMGEAEDLDKLIDNISEMIRIKGNGITTSQLRNIFGKIKPMTEIRQLKLIRPQLAYIAARQVGKVSGNAKRNIADFIAFLDELIRETDQNGLEGFKQFMESVVAYHKYHHPKNA